MPYSMVKPLVYLLGGVLVILISVLTLEIRDFWFPRAALLTMEVIIVSAGIIYLLFYVKP